MSDPALAIDPASPAPTNPAPTDPAPANPTADPAPSPAPGSPPSGYFDAMPDDWRKQLAGDDEKRLKQLERVGDMKSFVDNYFEAQRKIRAGEVSNGLPENPTDEQVAEWRAANGVPESPDKYELKLEEGLVLGDADKKLMDSVYKVAHGENVSAATMSKLTSAVLAARQAEAHERESQDGIDAQTATQQLRENWKGDHQVNINLVKGLMNTLPGELKEQVLAARLPNGKALFNSPEFLHWAMTTQRKLDPAAALVPNSHNPVGALDDIIKAAEKRMGDDPVGWHRDKAAQQQYMQALEAKERLSQS